MRRENRASGCRRSVKQAGRPTAVSFSVCVALFALAMAGSASAPVVPRTTAAPAAAMDLRTFMISS